MERCSFDGCERPSYCKGFCGRHYKRFNRYGDPRGIYVLNGERERFVRSVVNDHKAGISVSECIETPFSDGVHRYIGITAHGKRYPAHRFVCLSVHGKPIGERNQAAHSCGNHKCVNPSHIRWATAKENNADKIQHGTGNKGQAHNLAKLTDEAIAEIRTSQKRIDSRRLAEKYGVSRATINAARRMKTWGHIDLIRPWPKDNPSDFTGASR